MALSVPKRAADKPNATRIFPAGTWLVEIEESRTKEPPDFMYELRGKKPRVGGKPAELTGVQFGAAQPLNEGQEDPGNQKLFLELITIDSGIALQELDFKDANVGWGIKRDAATYINFAQALGQAYEEGGNVSASDDFLPQLQAGEFNGHKVIVEVEHSPWASKDGSKKGVNVDIVRFTPAA